MLCKSLDKEAAGLNFGLSSILGKRALRQSQNPGRVLRDLKENEVYWNYKEKRDRKIIEQLSGVPSLTSHSGGSLEGLESAISVQASVRCKKNSPLRGGLLLGGGGGSPQIVFDIGKKVGRMRDNTPYAKLMMPRKPLEGWQSSSTGFGSVKLDQRQSRLREKKAQLAGSGGALSVHLR